MVRLRSLRCIFIYLLIIADVLRINSRAVSIDAYNHNGNNTRQVPPYTIAIFKGEHQTPSHTIAVFKPQIPTYTAAAIKPFVSQTNLFAHDPLIYKPFLQPDQFTLVDQNESHEGEVFENDLSQPEADVPNQYYTFNTNQELFGNLTDEDSYFPIHDEITSNLNFTGYPAASPPIKNFTGYPNSAYITHYPVLLTTELTQLAVPQQQKDQPIAMTKDKLYSFYHLGYKFWYGMLLFVVYHAIIVIVFHLSKLAKHYLQFPAALQAAAASDRAKLGLQEDCTNNLGSKSFGTELPELLTFSNLLTQLFHIDCHRITHNQLASSGSSLKRIKNNWKWLMKIIPATDGQFRRRSIITQAIWNIPLYFNVYFILYMSYLILKSISGHKIILPTSY